MKLKKLFLLVLLFSLFVLYSGKGFPAYAFFLFLLFLVPDKYVISFPLVFAGMLLLTYFSFIVTKHGSIQGFYLIKNFWGFLVFYYIMAGYKMKLHEDDAVKTVLVVLSLCIIAEAAFVNLFPHLRLPVYPDFLDAESHRTYFYGFYQRPYSIGINSTVTGTILVVLISMVYKGGVRVGWHILLSLLALLLLVSGTAYMLMVVAFVLKNINFMKKKNIIAFAVFCALVYLTIDIFIKHKADTSFLDKANLSYLNYLWELKTEQIQETIKLLRHDYYSLYTGIKFKTVVDIPSFSDFGWQSFLLSNGLVGLCLLFLFIIFNLNRCNFIYVFLFVLAAFHYAALFSTAGQVLFALVLLIPRNRHENNCAVVSGS